MPSKRNSTQSTKKIKIDFDTEKAKNSSSKIDLNNITRDTAQEAAEIARAVIKTMTDGVSEPLAKRGKKIADTVTGLSVGIDNIKRLTEAEIKVAGQILGKGLVEFKQVITDSLNDISNETILISNRFTNGIKRISETITEFNQMDTEEFNEALDRIKTGVDTLSKNIKEYSHTLTDSEISKGKSTTSILSGIIRPLKTFIETNTNTLKAALNRFESITKSYNTGLKSLSDGITKRQIDISKKVISQAKSVSKASSDTVTPAMKKVDDKTLKNFESTTKTFNTGIKNLSTDITSKKIDTTKSVLSAVSSIARNINKITPIIQKLNAQFFRKFDTVTKAYNSGIKNVSAGLTKKDFNTTKQALSSVAAIARNVEKTRPAINKLDAQFFKKFGNVTTSYNSGITDLSTGLTKKDFNNSKLALSTVRSIANNVNKITPIIQKLNGAFFKKLDNITKTYRNSINTLSRGITKDKIDNSLGTLRVNNTAQKVTKAWTDVDLTKVNKQLFDGIQDSSVAFNASAKTLGNISKDEITNGKRNVKLMDELRTVIEKFASVRDSDFDRIKNTVVPEIQNITNTLLNTKISQSQKDNVDVFTKVTDAFNKTASSMDALKGISPSEMQNATDAFSAINNELSTLLKNIPTLDDQTIKSIDVNSKLINSSSALINNILKFKNVTDAEMQNIIKRDSQQTQLELKRRHILNEQQKIFRDERVKFEKEHNEQARQEAIERKRNPDWWVELKKDGLRKALFGQKWINMGTGEEETTGGTLGAEIKGGILNGIKGGIIGMLMGAVVGIISKILSTIKNIILAPIRMVMNIGKAFLGILKKTLMSAETFKSLIDLVLMPFTLLFTLLFAPVLMQLAPLITDVVQRVVDNMDKLDAAGQMIAHVLEYLFDDENWFSFGNIIQFIIDTILEFAAYAVVVFNTVRNEGQSGLDALVSVAMRLISAFCEKISAFLLSPEGTNLLYNVGRIVGTVLINVVQMFVSAIPGFFAGLGGIFEGGFETLIRKLGNIITLGVKGIINQMLDDNIVGNALRWLLGIDKDANIAQQMADAAADLGTYFGNSLDHLADKAMEAFREGNGQQWIENASSQTSYSSTTYNSYEYGAGGLQSPNKSKVLPT